MRFGTTENQQMIAEMLRAFGEQHIRPFMMEWDEQQLFPVELFRKLGELGCMGVLVPEKYGGAGFGYSEYVTTIVEISKICGSIGLSVAAHNSLCTNHILMFGNDEQKEKYLPKLATGEHIGAWGLTEPNTGSDAGNMQTTAVRDGDDWILNGSKNFITHGISGEIAVVMTRTGDPRSKNNSTAFIVERGTPGFSGGKKEDKLGMRASETSEMVFQDCRISDAQRLGDVGDGFKQALSILDGGRISIAALALGIAKGAFEASLKYAQEREQFGKPISSFQGISFKLADMATEIEAAELLTMNAVFRKSNGLKLSKESAMAKLYASEVAVRTTNEAVQIFGGYGYIKEFPVEKFFRDAKLCTIGEGTSEIQRLVISRELLK
ncbi:MAG: acyl-CoA dehydrogenase [Flavobacteriales bacterium]|nr:acyl-CoA dehydrogenase [Flavobacteriales bacterium]|tara:strand:+ start:826 stop:1965 length:1140 start_codon:yes stop_codon:yes gene_type:complete